jgi:hypothetical protein
MKSEIKRLIRDYHRQMYQFNRQIMGNGVEKQFPPSSTQKLHMGVGTINLEIVIPFVRHLNRKWLEESVLKLIQDQGLLRSVLVNHRGELVWRQHAAPSAVTVPFLDISAYDVGDQNRIVNRIVSARSLKKFTSHSYLYRLIAVKQVLTVYLRKYKNRSPLLFKLAVKLAALTRFLPKTCRGNALLYRLVIIRRNLRDHLLLIRLDHTMGDATTMELIQSRILHYYRSRGQAEMESPVPYDRYVKQVNRGPQGIDPGALTDLLAAKEYKHYAALVGDFIDRRNTRRVHHFHYRFNFKGEVNLTEERSWEMGFILINLLCKIVFNIPKIPVKIMYYGRNYGGQTYFNTCGEFWDLIPALIEVDEDEPLRMVRQVNQLIELSSSHNVNFVNLFLDQSADDRWAELIELVAPMRLVPPESTILIDFLGKGVANEQASEPAPAGRKDELSRRERRRRQRDLYVDIRAQGGFLVYIRYTTEAVVFDIDALMPFDSQGLSRQLDEKGRQVLSRISS